MSLADHLTPGVIDGSAEHVFTLGGCGALAIALHDATGWPVMAITDSHNVHDGRAGGGSALHWTVLHPSGRLLDVDGLHDVGDLVERYSGEADDGEAACGRSSRADAHEWWDEAGRKVPLELAATFVDAVLERAGEGKSEP
jgi:hypothetical protein